LSPQKCSRRKDSTLTEGANGWHKQAKLVDNWIEQVIQLRLCATQAKGIVETIAQNHTKRSRIERRLKQQLSGLAKEKSRLAAKFVQTDIPAWIEELKGKHLACEQREAQIRAKLADLAQENEQDRRVSELKNHIDTLAEHWNSLTREEKVQAIKLVVSEVWASPDENGDLRIVLIWKDQGICPNPETGEMPISPEYGMFTTPEGKTEFFLDDTNETTLPLGSDWTTRGFEHLRTLITQGASQVEICGAFPSKTWRQIRVKWALEA
jgi:predicted DNA-binding protein